MRQEERNRNSHRRPFDGNAPSAARPATHRHGMNLFCV
ncbi:hypothetical protein C725_1440 [Pacificimonas flava]|uniref:Uncharacterized protein n=1 Tax=Pacificimonas flava TaxID=1234595 RepID=M2TAC3_9SPHN|nr:hypothetical protein C725_1440 [Pacificimonas flava]